MPTLELTLQRKTDSGYPTVAALTRQDGSLPLRREGTLTLDTAALAKIARQKQLTAEELREAKLRLKRKDR
jgi:hypothetical protein